jgi:YjbE family integral membrane protein
LNRRVIFTGRPVFCNNPRFPTANYCVVKVRHLGYIWRGPPVRTITRGARRIFRPPDSEHDFPQFHRAPVKTLNDRTCMTELSPQMMQSLLALVEIMTLNIVLSGDNAVVIALACRRLSPAHQKQAFMWGSAGVVVLMLLLTAFVVFLMELPYLQIAGSVLLLWIGVKLLLDEEEDDGGKVEEKSTLAAAVKTIIIADIVMSLDNVLAMAGAAKGHLWMLGVGLVITIPVILFGSALLMRLMEKFPVFVMVGAALIGWVAGDMLVSDPAIRDWVNASAPYLHWVSPAVCAVFVIAAGKIIERVARK